MNYDIPTRVTTLHLDKKYPFSKFLCIGNNEISSPYIDFDLRPSDYQQNMFHQQ
jgi:hypothetical protein